MTHDKQSYKKVVMDKLQKSITDPHVLDIAAGEEYWHDGWDHIMNLGLTDEFDNIMAELEAKKFFEQKPLLC